MASRGASRTLVVFPLLREGESVPPAPPGTGVVESAKPPPKRSKGASASAGTGAGPSSSGVKPMDVSREPASVRKRAKKGQHGEGPAPRRERSNTDFNTNVEDFDAHEYAKATPGAEGMRDPGGLHEITLHAEMSTGFQGVGLPRLNSSWDRTSDGSTLGVTVNGYNLIDEDLGSVRDSIVSIARHKLDPGDEGYYRAVKVALLRTMSPSRIHELYLSGRGDFKEVATRYDFNPTMQKVIIQVDSEVGRGPSTLEAAYVRYCIIHGVLYKSGCFLAAACIAMPKVLALRAMMGPERRDLPVVSVGWKELPQGKKTPSPQPMGSIRSPPGAGGTPSPQPMGSIRSSTGAGSPLKVQTTPPPQAPSRGTPPPTGIVLPPSPTYPELQRLPEQQLPALPAAGPSGTAGHGRDMDVPGIKGLLEQALVKKGELREDRPFLDKILESYEQELGITLGITKVLKKRIGDRKTKDVVTSFLKGLGTPKVYAIVKVLESPARSFAVGLLERLQRVVPRKEGESRLAAAIPFMRLIANMTADRRLSGDLASVLTHAYETLKSQGDIESSGEGILQVLERGAKLHGYVGLLPERDEIVKALRRSRRKEKDGRPQR